MPFDLVQHRYMRSISGLMQSHPGYLDPRLLLWSLLTYVEAFDPVLGVEKLQLQSWLAQVTMLCGLTTWVDVRKTMDDFLWIDIVYPGAAQKLLREILP